MHIEWELKIYSILIYKEVSSAHIWLHKSLVVWNMCIQKPTIDQQLFLGGSKENENRYIQKKSRSLAVEMQKNWFEIRRLCQTGYQSALVENGQLLLALEPVYLGKVNCCYCSVDVTGGQIQGENYSTHTHTQNKNNRLNRK